MFISWSVKTLVWYNLEHAIMGINYVSMHSRFLIFFGGGGGVGRNLCLSLISVRVGFSIHAYSLLWKTTNVFHIKHLILPETQLWEDKYVNFSHAILFFFQHQIYDTHIYYRLILFPVSIVVWATAGACYKLC